MISEKTKKKMSISHKRFYNNGGETTKGKHWKLSDETKKKMSQYHKGRPKPWLIGKKHPPHSEETIRKIIEANIGRKLSKEIRNKMSKSQKGRVHSEETKLKMSLAQKGEKGSGWKGGITITLEKQEKIAGRKKPEQCEICGAFGKICFDHNHNTGKFRGWICFRCNVVLGFVKDNSELLIKLSEYLKNYN